MEYKIDWVDRETLAYRCEGMSVLVWVDFTAGLLSRGRIIHTDSISNWIDPGSKIVRAVTDSERAEIIRAVQKHYQREHRPCTLEP